MKRIIINESEFNTIRDDRAGDFSEPCKEFNEYDAYPIELVSEHWLDANGNPVT